MVNCSEWNEVLKLNFTKLHSTVVNNVNPVHVMNFLFQEHVIGDPDMRALMRFRDDPQQQCGELLALLHISENPQTFVKLYAAIKAESNLQWLIGRIDEFTDQSVIDLLQQQQQQQLNISDPTGVFFVRTILSKKQTSIVQ